MAHVLIIDDDREVCIMISEIVRRLEHEVHWELTLRDGFRAAREGNYDVVFLDVNLPDGNGLEFLPRIRGARSSPEVIIMTGYGIPDGVEIAVKNGAWDYIQKPFTPMGIISPLKRILQYRADVREVGKETVALRLEGVVGSSPGMRACLDLTAQAAESDANVLISGETGTGKELLARAIHFNSRRANGNWIVVDCAALPESLIESVLFGHEKGSFTGADRAREGLIEQADGGTLFLDEVGELPLTMQKVFLRVLQERLFRPLGGRSEMKSDFRLVAATNRDLNRMAREGRFRKDLLFRLKTIEIELPPLRDRGEDLKELIWHYLGRLSGQYGMSQRGLSPECLEALTVYDWPGNVRELVNTLEKALAAARNEPTLFPKHLPVHIRLTTARNSVRKAPSRPPDEKEQGPSFPFPGFKDYKENLLDEGERRYLRELMAFSRGSIKEACRISGLGRTWLYALLRKHDISRFGWPDTGGSS